MNGLNSWICEECGGALDVYDHGTDDDTLLCPDCGSELERDDDLGDER